jgi:ketosteroid isomerase-like protein
MMNGADAPVRPISKMDVEIAIRNYWIVLMSKQAEQHRECFTDNAFIFASTSRRLEPGQLVLLRREREYMAEATTINVNVGRVEVELLGEDAAVAAYTMRFDVEQKKPAGVASKRMPEEHLTSARVTHVFTRMPDGGLRIIHEHISVPDDPRDGLARAVSTQ